MYWINDGKDKLACLEQRADKKLRLYKRGLRWYLRCELVNGLNSAVVEQGVPFWTLYFAMKQAKNWKVPVIAERLTSNKKDWVKVVNDVRNQFQKGSTRKIVWQKATEYGFAELVKDYGETDYVASLHESYRPKRVDSPAVGLYPAKKLPQAKKETSLSASKYDPWISGEFRLPNGQPYTGQVITTESGTLIVHKVMKGITGMWKFRLKIGSYEFLDGDYGSEVACKEHALKKYLQLMLDAR